MTIVSFSLDAGKFENISQLEKHRLSKYH